MIGGNQVTELVEKAKQGDRKAFVTLIEKKKVQMYKTAFMQLNNQQDALDAIQEALLKAYERIYTLRDNKYFYTWFMRILLNECHNIQRMKKRIVPIEDKYMENQKRYDPDDFRQLEMKDLIARLGDKYREVIDLRYNHNMKHQEIAEVLDIPVGTVKSRINKAIKMLRKEIGERRKSK